MSIRRFPRLGLWAVLALAGLPARAGAQTEEKPAAPAAAPAAPAPSAAPAASAPAAPAAPGGDCLRFDDEAGLVAEALRSTTLAVGETTQALAETRFVGLTTLSEERVWKLVGGRPEGRPTIEQSAVLVARLAQSGLFAAITPAVKLSAAADGGAVFEITLVEHATVTAVEITGLGELTRSEILDALLVAPPARDGRDGHDGDDDDDDAHDGRRGSRHGKLALRCPAPVPPRDWVARANGERVRPGLVWKGIDAGLERVQALLAHQGYRLGTVSATLAADGRLTLAVDEGRLESVVVEGVAPSLRDDVLARLGVAPGAVFNVDDLRIGVHRVEAAYPFLHADQVRRPAPPSRVLVREAGEGGAVRFRFGAGPPRCDDDRVNGWEEVVEIIERRSERAHREHVDVDVDVDGLEDEIIGGLEGREDRDHDRRGGDDDERDCSRRLSWYHLEGRRLVVHFSAHRFEFDASGVELLRHTQVTGWAPGLQLMLHVWDPGDRLHFRFDTLVNLNTGRESFEPEDDGALRELAAAQRVDLLVAPSLSVPRLGLAELGVAAYSLTDTDDGYRVTDLDSYLNSALWDRPEREYYRRTGVSAFATFHLFESLTLGAEYRYDRHDSMARLDDVNSIFGDNPGYPNPAIDDGLYGSMIFRAGWSTRPTSRHDVVGGGGRRGAQGSIIDFDDVGRPESGLRTNATLELADPALGGDADFWRVTSDSVFSLETGDDQGVFLRLRVGGGDDLPRQREEALGGWGTLRGYGFKELRGGDWSVLSSLEYRFDGISAFVDVGALRGAVDGEWEGPRLGLGTALNLGYSGQLAFAWRTDADAEATPEVRLVFGRPW